MAKEKTIWKTKEVDGQIYMICQNSNPSLSKYPEWGPDSGVCDKWSQVVKETAAVICSDCTQRSLKI
jgi:hypothetical protein